MQGSRGRDFTAAYKEAGISRAEALKYTWHHVDDFDPDTGKTTMQLVKTDGVHKKTGHIGSVSQFEKYFKVDYDTRASIKFSESLGWLTGRKPRY
ncbi:HNH endonuclease [Salmonella enterica]|nr:HNH endonuclease [Salmonella enterica]